MGSDSLVIVDLRKTSNYYNAELEQDHSPRVRFFSRRP